MTAAWKVYDSGFVLKSSNDANGSTTLPGSGDGAYLLVFGAAGAAVTVNIA